ncbi:MAG: hypothetical protein M1825_004138 [Sarcosagium campestre]|nr:MAG: hypothetical protein M1825_004138 [Sarcosagium campestre]
MQKLRRQVFGVFELFVYLATALTVVLAVIKFAEDRYSVGHEPLVKRGVSVPAAAWSGLQPLESFSSSFNRCWAAAHLVNNPEETDQCADIASEHLAWASTRAGTRTLQEFVEEAANPAGKPYIGHAQVSSASKEPLPDASTHCNHGYCSAVDKQQQMLIFLHRFAACDSSLASFRGCIASKTLAMVKPNWPFAHPTGHLAPEPTKTDGLELGGVVKIWRIPFSSYGLAKHGKRSPEVCGKRGADGKLTEGTELCQKRNRRKALVTFVAVAGFGFAAFWFLSCLRRNWGLGDDESDAGSAETSIRRRPDRTLLQSPSLARLPRLRLNPFAHSADLERDLTNDVSGSNNNNAAAIAGKKSVPSSQAVTRAETESPNWFQRLIGLVFGSTAGPSAASSPRPLVKLGRRRLRDEENSSIAIDSAVDQSVPAAPKAKGGPHRSSGGRKPLAPIYNVNDGVQSRKENVGGRKNSNRARRRRSSKKSEGHNSADTSAAAQGGN